MACLLMGPHLMDEEGLGVCAETVCVLVRACVYAVLVWKTEPSLELVRKWLLRYLYLAQVRLLINVCCLR